MKHRDALLAWLTSALVALVLLACTPPVDPGTTGDPETPADTSSSDAWLSSLTLGVDGAAREIGFQKATLSYSANVGTSVASVAIGATASDSGATLSGTGTVALGAAGTTTDCPVVVTAADGATKKTYTIKVTRASAAASSDASLSALSIASMYAPVTITPAFSTDTLAYAAAALPYAYSAVTISATATDAGAVVSGVGTKAVSVGSSSLTVNVVAADGVTTKAYTIALTRYGQESSLLSALTVSGASFAFDPETTSYAINVANSVSEATVSATPEYSGSTVALSLDGDEDYETAASTGTVSLTEGAVATVKVRVQSQYDKSYGYYEIAVTRAAAGASSDASLLGLGLIDTNSTSVALSPSFDPATTSYTATVASTSKTVSVLGTASDSGATVVSGTGDAALAVGPNAIKVVVLAADGVTTKTYTVTVTRNSPPSITITSPSPGSTITAGTTTFTGTLSDPAGEVTKLMAIVGTSFQKFAASSGTFSLSVDTSGLANGEQTITLIDSRLACHASVTVQVTGGFDGHSASLAVGFLDGRSSATGYLCVLYGEATLLVSNMKLDGSSLPCELSIPGLKDGTWSLYVIFTEEPFAFDYSTITYAAPLPSFTIAGADLDIGSVLLSEYSF